MMKPLTWGFARAWRLGRRTVGTEFVLEQVISMSQSRTLNAELLPVLSPLRRRLLSDRGEVASACSGIDGHGAGSDAVDLEVDALLRDAAWWARCRRRRAWATEGPVWTTEVRATVRSALVRAAAAGVYWAHLGHLLVTMCRDGSRAAGMLDELGVHRGHLSELVMRGDGEEGDPFAMAALFLRFHGVLSTRSRGLYRALMALARADTSGWRPGGFRPFIRTVNSDAVRRGVRLGADQISAAHVLVAVCELDDELRRLGERIRARWASHHAGAEILRRHGVTVAAATAAARRLTVREPPAQRNRTWRIPGRSSPPYGRSVLEAADAAQDLAGRLGHRYAGMSHIVMALLADEHGPARLLLRELDVDLPALTDDITRVLGQVR